jgi:hypothetical protein
VGPAGSLTSMHRAAVVIALLSLAACGGSQPGSQGPTASTVAAQQGDVPAGMVRCDLTGDIDSFLSQEKTADPSNYQSTKSQWDDAKAKGATAAYVAIFADSKAHCDAVKTSGSDVGAATFKVVVNFVIQFKDQSSAAKAYTSETVFSMSSADLKKNASSTDLVEGDKTGLSPNSVVIDTLVVNQKYYIAVWQKDHFMVILAIKNVDSASAKKVATSENSRIR